MATQNEPKTTPGLDVGTPETSTYFDIMPGGEMIERPKAQTTISPFEKIPGHLLGMFGKWRGIFIRIFGQRLPSSTIGDMYAFHGKIYVFPAMIFYGDRS